MSQKLMKKKQKKLFLKQEMSNLVLRTLSGVLYVVLIIGAMLLGELASFVLLGVVVLLSVFELFKLLLKDAGRLLPIYGFSLAIVSYMSVSFFSSSLYDGYYNIFPLLSLFFVFALPILLLFSKKTTTFKNLAIVFVGTILIAIPLGLINLMFVSVPAPTDYIYPLAFFVLIWVSDTFAYLTGTAFGKHRLFERLSPKKSWEGSIGGLVFAMGASLIFAYYSNGLNVWEWLGFAAVVVVFGTFGDLFESMLKRSLGVKDSGSMMPGHGGILDRFDSIFLAAPFVIIYFELLKICA